ncbi:GDSL-type esterase/lipase family protein [Streptomyces roseolilacinus]|uniref:GDSL-type esterase/lipase family protein n=1 Tax=Streptomyces roseolilacinus TaxID=66904 RepID=UPI00382EEAB3
MSFVARAERARPPSARAGHRWTALGCVLALLAGLAAVIAAPTDAVALQRPQDIRVATQNMQQRALWNARIALLTGHHDVIALQEVPHGMANGERVPLPPSSDAGNRLQLLTDRGGAGQLPALPPRVTEYRWNAGTAYRQREVYLYLLQTSDVQQLHNLPVGMITSQRAWNALDVHHAGSRRNALVVLDDSHRMAYASFHANATPNNRGHEMVQQIANEVGALGQNGGQPWNWAVIGDFNRQPDTMANSATIRNLGATVIFPRDAHGNPARTHTSPGAGTLDYMVTSAPQTHWHNAYAIGGTAWGDSGSDHFSVSFGGTLRAQAEPGEALLLENNAAGAAGILTGDPGGTPNGEVWGSRRNQTWRPVDHTLFEDGHVYFKLQNVATSTFMLSGSYGVVGDKPYLVDSALPAQAWLWRFDGDTIRNTSNQRLAMSGNDRNVGMHKPVPVDPDPSASWSIHTVDLDHLDTAGFPVDTDKPVYLVNRTTERSVREDAAADRVVEGHLRDHMAGADDEKWVLRPSALPGSVYLINRRSGHCLSAETTLPLMFPVQSRTRPCPAAGSGPDAALTLSWHYVDGQVQNAHTGAALGHAPTASPTLGTGLTVFPEHTTRFHLMPTGDTVPGLPGEPPPPHDELKKLAVMPLGDSITLGVGSGTRTGYRPALAQMLAQDAPDVRFVGSMQDADGTRHEGHSGWRIDQISANVERWMEQAKPNLVLLHIGTNDMNRDYQVDTAPQRLAGLIDQIHGSSPNTAIVVASLVPAADRTVQARVSAYNRAIPGIVADRARRGYRITQVSMSTLTVADLDDDLHPNDRGYLKMAGTFHGGVVTAARNKWIDENVTVKPAPPGTGSPTATGDYRVDVDGDGRSDYLVVEDNGAVRAWTSSTAADGTVKWAARGVIATGSAQWTGDQVRFADVGGDARADYLVLAPNGAVRAFVNEGGDGRGGWRDLGTIASGSTAWNSAQVRFADIGGDARADYLVVSDRGAVRAFLHTTTATGAVKWSDQGTVATGSDRWTAEDVRFADVGGDTKADYLIVAGNGAIQAYVNTTTADGTVRWDGQGHIASGSSQWTGDQVRFGDVTGDARADYLVLAPDGALTAYENTTGAGATADWKGLGVIATGTGSPAARVRI